MMPPKTILVMRNGEKPTDRSDRHLTAAGRRRAERLAKYIPSHFGKPGFIFAASPSHSQRPVETMEPLATTSNLQINSSFPARDFKKLAAVLVRGGEYSGELVVVCWRHEFICAFAKALGAHRDDFLKRWRGTVFDLILVLDYPKVGSPHVLQVLQPF